MALTKKDLDKIDERISDRLRVNLDSHKEEMIEIIDDKFDSFKSELFDKIDPILKEVVIAREERPLIENRLEKLEEIHPEGKHANS